MLFGPASRVPPALRDGAPQPSQFGRAADEDVAEAAATAAASEWPLGMAPSAAAAGTVPHGEAKGDEDDARRDPGRAPRPSLQYAVLSRVRPQWFSRVAADKGVVAADAEEATTGGGAAPSVGQDLVLVVSQATEGDTIGDVLRGANWADRAQQGDVYVEVDPDYPAADSDPTRVYIIDNLSMVIWQPNKREFIRGEYFDGAAWGLARGKRASAQFVKEKVDGVILRQCQDQDFSRVSLDAGRHVAWYARPPVKATLPSILEAASTYQSPPVVAPKPASTAPTAPHASPTATPPDLATHIAAADAPPAAVAAVQVKRTTRDSSLIGRLSAVVLSSLVSHFDVADVVAVACASAPDESFLRRHDGLWRDCIVRCTALHTSLHEAALVRYRSWHAFAVAVLRARHDVAGLLSLPTGYNCWRRVVMVSDDDPASATLARGSERDGGGGGGAESGSGSGLGSGAGASVAMATASAAAAASTVHASGSGSGGGASGTLAGDVLHYGDGGVGDARAAVVGVGGFKRAVIVEAGPDEPGAVWARFPRVLGGLWAARLALRGDALQLGVDICGDDGDLHWLGIHCEVLWRGVDVELELATITGSRTSGTSDSDGYSMVGVQDGLDMGVGWISWRASTEDTSLQGLWRGRTKDEVEAYLRDPDAAPMVTVVHHQSEQDVIVYDALNLYSEGGTLLAFLLENLSGAWRPVRGGSDVAREWLADIAPPGLRRAVSSAWTGVWSRARVQLPPLRLAPHAFKM